MGKENKEPTFIEQAFAIIEETYAEKDSNKEYGMKIADHKLLCRILDTHEQYINEQIIDRFVVQIAKHYEPIMNKLESIESDVSHIKDKVKDIEVNYNDLSAKLYQLKQNIPDELETQLVNLQKTVNEIKKISNKKAIWIRALIIGGAAIAITLFILWLALPWFHDHYLEITKPNIEQVR